MRPLNSAASGVFSDDCRYGVGVDSRPLLTSGRAKGSDLASSSTASRKRRLPLLLGVMKSVDRVELQQVVVGRERALLVVAVEQLIGCRARLHQRQLPGQVVGVLHAGVGAARAERRHLVCRIAGEQHAPDAKFLHASAGELIDRHPLQLEPRLVAQHRLDARDHALGFLLLVRDRRPSRAGNRCATRCRPACAAAPTGWGGTADRTRTSARSGSRPASPRRRSGSGPGRTGR